MRDCTHPVWMDDWILRWGSRDLPCFVTMRKRQPSTCPAICWRSSPVNSCRWQQLCVSRIRPVLQMEIIWWQEKRSKKDTDLWHQCLKDVKTKTWWVPIKCDKRIKRGQWNALWGSMQLLVQMLTPLFFNDFIFICGVRMCTAHTHRLEDPPEPDLQAFVNCRPLLLKVELGSSKRGRDIVRHCTYPSPAPSSVLPL